MSQQGSKYLQPIPPKHSLTSPVGGGLLGGLGDTLGKTVGGLTNTVGDTVGGLGNTVDGATSGVGSTVSGATEGLGNTTKGAGQTLSSSAESGTKKDTPSIGGKEQTAQNRLGL